jgi:hypothetical protein
MRIADAVRYGAARVLVTNVGQEDGAALSRPYAFAISVCVVDFAITVCVGENTGLQRGCLSGEG